MRSLLDRGRLSHFNRQFTIVVTFTINLCYNKKKYLISYEISAYANVNKVEIINTRAKSFFKSEEGKLLRQELIRMTQNKLYNTRTTYSTCDANGLSFVDKHMRYMSQYPNLNYSQYVSNLKLITKLTSTSA